MRRRQIMANIGGAWLRPGESVTVIRSSTFALLRARLPSGLHHLRVQRDRAGPYLS